MAYEERPNEPPVILILRYHRASNLPANERYFSYFSWPDGILINDRTPNSPPREIRSFLKTRFKARIHKRVQKLLSYTPQLARYAREAVIEIHKSGVINAKKDFYK